ncbi:MAG: diacylglycerol kinase [Thermoanaerobaculia bacterium]
MADGQKLTGLRRILRSTRVSYAGFRHGLLHEAAIREVAIGASVLIILSALLPVTNLEHLVLMLSTLLVVVVEFVNSAIESAVDRISKEHHPLSGLAKDYANVAVVIAVLMMGMSWLVIAGPLLMRWLRK